MKGGVVGPSGVSAAPGEGRTRDSPPGSSLPPPVSESFCPLWALLLPPAGPRSPRKDKVQLLSVSRGPDWPRAGGVLSMSRTRAAKRPWSKWAGVPALPPRCVLSSRKSQNQSGHPTGLFSLGLLPRGADVAGPPAAFGLTCLGDAGSRARGTWEVHGSRTRDRVGKRAAELK